MTRSWREGAHAASAVLALGLALTGCARAPTFAGAPPYETKTHFAVIGDLQRTLPGERAIGRESNDRERRQLLPEIARRNPAFVVMVGDLVSWGASAREWHEFDARAAPLRAAGTGVLAVPGNHDYFGGGKLESYFRRLPLLEGRHWYERRYGPLAMLFLDSNAGPLGKDLWSAERRWYEDALARLALADDVLGILVFLHHAPYTNGSVVHDSAPVDEAFVPAFRANVKTMAFITGHSHGYEHFQYSDKAFIVTGGGGGPRLPLLTGTARPHPDEVFQGPPLRNFNFIDFRIGKDGLHGDVVGLPKGSETFCRMETLDLGWPASTDPAVRDAWARALPPEPSPEPAQPKLLDCYPR